MHPNTRNRLVVAADDYGVRETTSAILPLVENDRLDRVAVLVRHCSPEDARALSLLRTKIGIDLHMDLSGLLGRGDDPGDGFFRRLSNFVVAILLGRLSSSRVRDEWRKQIELFRALFGTVPDGLNSHEHVHYFPLFSRVAFDLAGEYGIQYVRFGTRGMLRTVRQTTIGTILHLLSRLSYRELRKSGLASSEYLVSLDWVSDRFDRLLLRLPKGPVELVVHPERPEERDFIRTRIPSRTKSLEL